MWRVAQGAAPKKVDIENCLYLNVWSPEWSGNAPAGTKKPVMFWINGGGLMGGSGVLRDGAESLPQHGVVMVSANYRGNLMGMMGHPELTAESPHRSSAMYGAHDEIAVLNWIQKNIERFGGDPNNVTVFGQSGGGHMISMLLASPRTKGLIHKAIINSGAPYQAVAALFYDDAVLAAGGARMGRQLSEYYGRKKLGALGSQLFMPASVPHPF